MSGPAGRLLGQVVGLLAAVLVSGPRLVTEWAALAGRRGSLRVLRVCVVVQRDEHGVPVAEAGDVQDALAWASGVFRTQAGVCLVPEGWAPGEELGVPADDPRFVTVADEISGPPTLDVTCTVRSWLADLGASGKGFRQLVRAAGGRGLPGYGTPVWVLAVRSFTSRHLGCSLGPLTDHVTVRFAGERTTLAHELGHACGLWHTRPGTLMDRRSSRSPRLASWQAWMVRASRHVLAATSTAT